MGTAPRIASRGTDPSKLSFRQLDAAFDERAAVVKRDFIALIPFLREMRERLHAQGKRNDLPDRPPNLGICLPGESTHFMVKERYFFKLIPPRPTFLHNMTDGERLFGVRSSRRFF